jgi:hypothetical protein
VATWGPIEPWPFPAERGLLRAKAQQAAADDEMCATAPEARYRGLENQLYRVEMHSNGPAGTATFKWSRDNGSVVFPIASRTGAEVVVTTLGRDGRLDLEVGDWVEVVDDAYTARGERQPLCRVKAIDPLDRLVTLESPPTTTVGEDATRHPHLRRWDQQQKKDARFGKFDANQHALVVAEDTWIELEDGVQVQFKKTPDTRYHAGDYWLIPARTETADVEWDVEDNDGFRSPDGVRYHVAPLAFVKAAGTDPVDLRRRFEPLKPK